MSKSKQLEKCERLKEKIQTRIAKEEKERSGIEEKLSILKNDFFQEIKEAIIDSQVKLNKDLLEVARRNNQ